MMKKVKLGEVCNLSIGFVGTVTTQYEEGGIPFLRTLNIKPDKIVDDDLKRITKDFHLSQKKSILNENDIVMVHTGVPGICCVIPKEYDNSNCIDMIVIKPKADKVDSQYLATYMNVIGVKHIQNQQVGCIQKHFNLKDAVDFEIFLPEIEIQKKIGKFVRKVNQKIENNNQINYKFEEFLRTLYQRWFIEFEFPDKEGNSYKSHGGKLVYDELLKRNIPENWKSANIMDYISWEGTSQPPKSCFIYEEKEGYIRFIQNRDYDDNSHLTYIPKNKALGICNQYDILMDKYGDAGRTRFGLAGAYNVALAKINVKDMKYREYIRNVLGSNSIYNYLHNSSMASTRASLNENNISYINIAIPDERILEKFNRYAEDYINTYLVIKSENQKLTELKEYLLPLLMNGQINVDDIKI